jgi:hypothetical protein
MGEVIEVSSEAVANTEKCSKYFECLFNNGQGACRVEDCIGSEILFVEYPDERHCGYMKPFGNSHYCTCPIRKELYINHKL